MATGTRVGLSLPRWTAEEIEAAARGVGRFWWRYLGGECRERLPRLRGRALRAFLVARQVGYLVVPRGAGGDRARNLWWLWCQARGAPFLCVWPRWKRGSRLELDLSTAGEGVSFAEEDLGDVFELVQGHSRGPVWVSGGYVQAEGVSIERLPALAEELFAFVADG